MQIFSHYLRHKEKYLAMIFNLKSFDIFYLLLIPHTNIIYIFPFTDRFSFILLLFCFISNTIFQHVFFFIFIFLYFYHFCCDINHENEVVFLSIRVMVFHVLNSSVWEEIKNYKRVHLVNNPAIKKIGDIIQSNLFIRCSLSKSLYSYVAVTFWTFS